MAVRGPAASEGPALENVITEVPLVPGDSVGIVAVTETSAEPAAVVVELVPELLVESGSATAELTEVVPPVSDDSGAAPA